MQKVVLNAKNNFYFETPPDWHFKILKIKVTKERILLGYIHDWERQNLKIKKGEKHTIDVHGSSFDAKSAIDAEFEYEVL